MASPTDPEPRWSRRPIRTAVFNRMRSSQTVGTKSGGDRAPCARTVSLLSQNPVSCNGVLCFRAGPVSRSRPASRRADLVEQGQRVGGVADQHVDHPWITGQRHVADIRFALQRDAVVVADLRRSWENWCMGFCLCCQAGRHHGAAHAMRGANWCMGFWCRLTLRAPGVVRGSGAWASGLRVLLGDACGRVCGTRGSKQEIWNHRCTQMHTDGTVRTASARLLKVGCRVPAVNEPAGLRPIGVHLRACVVPNFLLGRVPNGSAWQ